MLRRIYLSMYRHARIFTDDIKGHNLRKRTCTLTPHRPISQSQCLLLAFGSVRPLLFERKKKNNLPLTVLILTVTGTSSGFGLQMARCALANGDRVVATLRDLGITVATGTFGADMAVMSVNDGPVTLVVDVPPPAR